MKSGRNIAFKKITKGDVFAAIFVVLAAVILFIFLNQNNGGNYVTVRCGEKTSVYELNKNTVFRVENNTYSLEITIKDGEVYVSSCNCPDRVCYETGKIKKGSIVCLPAQIIIEVGEGDIDYVAG